MRRSRATRYGDEGELSSFAPSTPRPAESAARQHPENAHVLDLQRLAGNAAVAGALRVEAVRTEAPIVQREEAASPAPAAPVDDDTKIRSIISGARTARSGPVPSGPLQALGDACWTTFTAWQDLKLKRDGGNKDLNLAAAEHYMFARFAVGAGWPPDLLMAMATLYTMGKVLGIRIPLGEGKVSPASTAQLKWGQLGALDGIQDRSLLVGAGGAGNITLVDQFLDMAPWRRRVD